MATTVVASGTILTFNVVTGEKVLGVATTAVIAIETRVAVAYPVNARTMMRALVDAVKFLHGDDIISN